MPEGDTIEALARRIDGLFAGQQVTRSVARDPRLTRLDLTGAVLVESLAVGKHLLLRFDSGATVYAHLRMDGRFDVGPASRAPEWQRRLELWFPNGRLTAVDVPVLGHVATSSEHEIVGHLGPDLCGAIVPDPAAVATRLQTDPERPLAGALLDQRLVAGFGNVFAVEVPFICGLSPFQPVGTIAGLDDLVRVGTALIRWSMGDNARNTTGRRMRGPSYWVYGHDGGRCPICGAALENRAADGTPWGRNTVWCPECQALKTDGAVANADRARRRLALHPARRDAFRS
ncbi:MAG TPA: DNA-formamidopyrimidine glycosylase family protein [Ilumatobacter sp.]|nr:DNA-formamidopyrimidine glycosylase family protein [Ilumatobacter sp.]